MIKFAKQNYRSEYSMLSNNCADLVNQTIRAGGSGLYAPSTIIAVPNRSYDLIKWTNNGTYLQGH